MDGVRDGMFLKKSNQIISDPGKILWAVTDEKLVAHDFFLVTICMDENQRKEKIYIFIIDTGVLLENIPLVTFIKTTSGTRVVYFP